MIIGIWRAKRDPSKTLEAYIAFQNDVVIPGMRAVAGCLGVLNFHSEEEWGTIQIWESREADLAEDSSPEAKHIYDELQKSGLMPKEDEVSYEWFEVHNGFAVKDVFGRYFK